MLILVFVAFIFAGVGQCYAQSKTANSIPPTWYTLKDDRYTYSAELSEEEAYDIVSSPMYHEIADQKKQYSRKFLEFATGFEVMQLKQNTGEAIVLGYKNIFPAISFHGTIWPQNWLGIDAYYTRGIIVTRGANADEEVSNQAIMMPTWLDLNVKLRYTFDRRDGSSYVAFRVGYHRHTFPINTSPDFISKKSASGINLGAQRRFAITNSIGFDFNFDFMFLNKLTDDSSIPNSQNGTAYKFGVDFYGTITSNDGLDTVLSIGYGQLKYVSRLSGEGVEIDTRDYLGAHLFEQIYNTYRITFTAKI